MRVLAGGGKSGFGHEVIAMTMAHTENHGSLGLDASSWAWTMLGGPWPTDIRFFFSAVPRGPPPPPQLKKCWSQAHDPMVLSPDT